MNKGKTFKELKSQILNNLNLTFNKSTGYAPYECIYQNSAVDLLKRKKEVDLEKVRQKLLAASEERREKANRKRITHEFKEDAQVLVHKSTVNKVEDRLVGPYRIVKMDASGNQAKLDIDSRWVWDNVRRLVPFWRSRCRVWDHHLYFN